MVARLCDKYNIMLAWLQFAHEYECLKFNTFTLLPIKVNSLSVIWRLRGLRKFREFHLT